VDGPDRARGFKFLKNSDNFNWAENRKWRLVGPESGLDRMESTLFVLVMLSRTARSAATSGGLQSLTTSPTRTTSIHAIKAATPIGLKWLNPRHLVEEP
jgi:hypothetical protein